MKVIKHNCCLCGFDCDCGNPTSCESCNDCFEAAEKRIDDKLSDDSDDDLLGGE